MGFGFGVLAVRQLACCQDPGKKRIPGRGDVCSVEEYLGGAWLAAASLRLTTLRPHAYTGYLSTLPFKRAGHPAQRHRLLNSSKLRLHECLVQHHKNDKVGTSLTDCCSGVSLMDGRGPLHLTYCMRLFPATACKLPEQPANMIAGSLCIYETDNMIRLHLVTQTFQDFAQSDCSTPVHVNNIFATYPCTYSLLPTHLHPRLVVPIVLARRKDRVR